MAVTTHLEAAYARWVAEGEPRDVNGSVPHEVKMFYVARTITGSGARVFVESGTSHGDGVAAILPYVDRVITIEAWDEAFRFAAKRFKNEPKVQLLFGDSAEWLPRMWEPPILSGYHIDEPAVFWLDAHYSGEGTAKLDKETPIVAELEAIARSPHAAAHSIVIDDARGFGVWPDYPPTPEMEAMCADLFPGHRFFLEGDEIFVVPLF